MPSCVWEEYCTWSFRVFLYSSSSWKQMVTSNTCFFAHKKKWQWFADKWIFQMSGEHKWCDGNLCPGQTLAALLASISISPQIMCELCRLCAGRCLWKLARLDRGEDLTSGPRPRASFNEIIREHSDDPDSAAACSECIRTDRRTLPCLCFHQPLFQTNTEPVVRTLVLFPLTLSS